MKIISKSKEFLLLTLLLNAGALVLFGFLFTQVRAGSQRTSALLNEIELGTKEESTLKSIKALVQETEPLRAKLGAYFVPQEGVAEFISLLEAAGKRGGVAVTITTVEEADVPDSAELETLKVALAASGTWENVVRFLGILESLPYQSSVDQAVLSRVPEGWHIDSSISVLKIQ